MKPSHVPFSQLIKQKNFLFLLASASVVLVLAGVYFITGMNNNSSNDESTYDTTAQALDPNAVLSVDDIRVIGEKDAPSGATISNIELQNDQGVKSYKVTFSDTTFKLYDARTGLVQIMPEASIAEEVDASVPANYVAGITAKQALNIAQNQLPESEIAKIVLTVDNTVVLYSVQFKDEGRVDINASNGYILRISSTENSEAQN